MNDLQSLMDTVVKFNCAPMQRILTLGRPETPISEALSLRKIMRDGSVDSNKSNEIAGILHFFDSKLAEIPSKEDAEVEAEEETVVLEEKPVVEDKIDTSIVFKGEPGFSASLKSLKEGDSIMFLRDDHEMVAVVNRVTMMTVKVEVEGDPDLTVYKRSILGISLS